ncbi:fumarate lyase [Microvirga vignae]|uniref:Fumarate lyase n=1 Tax=Microvirga vignae TaxID=1225564 RepID=A0A0H1RJR0_9HYPH|nr:adenylosuccinate lyase family protein [Microvirga vignae]KLK92837.1 fumarate lyase [Microvirga vignae]
MTFAALDSSITGPLFATEAMRTVFSDQARLGAMLRMEAALARAQTSLGLVPDGLAPAIEAISPEAIDLEALGCGTALAGVPAIPFVKAVQARLPPALEASFHKGATTQDVVDTALVLQMRDAFDVIEADLAVILDGLSRLAAERRDTVCAGRSYGQHAAPITFGFKVAVWLTGLYEMAGQLPWLRKRVLVASLGGPVGTLAGLGDKGPAVVDAVAHELGLETAPGTWHTLRARMAETGTWLATLIGTLAMMAVDIGHLASTEVGEVAEPYVPGRGGSSAMPHKRNPVSSTVIMASQTAAKGHLVTLLDAMAAAHERSAGGWHGEWHALPSLFGSASGALHEARPLAEGLVIHSNQMRANLDLIRGLLFADAAATRLAPQLGREEAHKPVERAAAEVRQTGESLQKTVLARLAPISIEEAFDLTPAIQASGLWVDRALAEAAPIRNSLSRKR